MTVTVTVATNKGDLKYVENLFPKFFNKNNLPKITQKLEDGSSTLFIAKRNGKRVGFVIWHELSKEWIYIDYIAATGYGEELIKTLHNKWYKEGYKGINLDTFIYDGELPRLASTRRINFFYKAGYKTDVIDHPNPGYVTFHMTHKFGRHGGGSEVTEQKTPGKPMSNIPRLNNVSKLKDKK
jgi:hypothetical protein